MFEHMVCGEQFTATRNPKLGKLVCIIYVYVCILYIVCV